MHEFHRIRRLPPYVFEEVNRFKATARAAGADIVDLGMGNPDLAAPPHVVAKLCETAGRPRTDRYSASKRHRRAAPRPGRLLRAPLRGKAQPRHAGRGDARLQGGLRQHGPGDHGAGRRGAGAEPLVSHSRLRVPDGRRHHPVGFGRAEPGLLPRARAGGAALHPQAARGGGLLSGEPDRHHGVARLLPGPRCLREAARAHRPVRPRLFGGVFRRRSAALRAPGAGRDGRDGRVHVDVQDLFDGGMADRLRGRQRAPPRGAGAREILPRLRRLHARCRWPRALR